MRNKSENAQSVKIHGVTVAPGDIVFIKFKKLEDVLKDHRKLARVNQVLDFYQIDNHTETLLKGQGHFKVEYVSDENDYLRLNPDRDPIKRSRKQQLLKAASPSSKTSTQNQQEIDSEKYVLEEICIMDHNTETEWSLNEILIEEIRVENEVAESYFSEKHEVSLVLINSVLYLNGAPVTSDDVKIFQMFEKVMADAAINSMFTAELEKEEDDF